MKILKNIKVISPANRMSEQRVPYNIRNNIALGQKAAFGSMDECLHNYLIKRAISDLREGEGSK